MSNEDLYDRARVYLEAEGVDWMGDGALGQLVCVELSDQTGLSLPACVGLWPSEARELASSLLAAAERAERLARHPRPATP